MHGNVFWKLKYTDYDAAEYRKDETVREKSQDRSGFDQVEEADVYASSSSKSAIRNELNESTTRDEKGNSLDDDAVRQKNSAKGSPSVIDGSYNKTVVTDNSTASADNAINGKVQFPKSVIKKFFYND